MTHKHSKSITLLFALSIYLFLSSCGFVHESKIEIVNYFSQFVNEQQYKPIVYLDFKKFRGHPDKESISLNVGQTENEIIYDLLKKSGVFSEIIYDSYEKSRSEYTIEMSEYEYQPSVGASIGGALLTGFTLMIIPSSHDMRTILDTKLLDKQGNTVHHYRNEEQNTYWIGLFAPLFVDNIGFFPGRETLENQYRDSLKNLSETKFLKK